jgi:enoyl-CoA hydratase/carnithine racemase
MELRRSDTGNILTTETTAIIQARMETYKNNDAVSCVWFTSHDPDLFSFGLDGASKNPDLLKNIHSMALAIPSYNKITLAMYGGAMTGTAFAAFAGSKFKLGANTLSLKLTELAQGTLPAAGLAYYFANAYEGGTAMARYLAATGRSVHADELFQMGLLTHLVEEEAQNTLTHTLAETLPAPHEDAKLKVERDTGTVVRELSVAALLDTMHIEEDMDVLGHAAWNKYILVPPGRWDTLPPEEDVSQDLTTIDEQVTACFGANNSIADTRTALGAIDSPWAREALQRMDALDAGLLQQWWDLTAFAADTKNKLPEVLEQELALYCK